jgi:hypothetical protein
MAEKSQIVFAGSCGLGVQPGVWVMAIVVVTVYVVVDGDKVANDVAVVVIVWAGGVLMTVDVIVIVWTGRLLTKVAVTVVV